MATFGDSLDEKCAEIFYTQAGKPKALLIQLRRKNQNPNFPVTCHIELLLLYVHCTKTLRFQNSDYFLKNKLSICYCILISLSM